MNYLINNYCLSLFRSNLQLEGRHEIRSSVGNWRNGSNPRRMHRLVQGVLDEEQSGEGYLPAKLHTREALQSRQRGPLRERHPHRRSRRT